MFEQTRNPVVSIIHSFFCGIDFYFIRMNNSGIFGIGMKASNEIKYGRRNTGLYVQCILGFN